MKKKEKMKVDLKNKDPPRVSRWEERNGRYLLALGKVDQKLIRSRSTALNVQGGRASSAEGKKIPKRADTDTIQGNTLAKGVDRLRNRTQQQVN